MKKPAESSRDLIRTTIFLPRNMKLNLELYAIQQGEREATIVRTALRDYLKSRGYQPDKKPVVRVNWPRSKQ